MSEEDHKSEDPAAQSEAQTLEGPVSEFSDSSQILKERFGHYEIAGKLGSGGMGIVYKAYDPALKRFAALKLIRTENPDHALRFVNEARAQARVQHENVCQVYEVGEVDGKKYIAMQFIEGQSLSAASKDMSTEVKVKVIKQIAEALHAAHKHGLIHRDVKPSNIMLELTEGNESKPYVLDFGLARDQETPGLTRTGVAVGTPYYMAPEQVSGERDHLDRRTDVYGLGATLYELLSGTPPYKGKSGTEILLQILKDDPLPLHKVAPKIPHDLETIVMKCLERDPSRRYESSKALADDLQRYLDGDPLAATPISWSYRLVKRARKNRLAAAITIAAAIITLILVSSFIWVQWQNKLQAEYAREFGDEVKNIQSVLPNIYTAPIHDVRPEIAAVRNRLRKMEERVKQGGRAAQAPGNNALGQGYLALGEIEKARTHLEKAWNSGYQLPSTAYALGQTMGLLYQEKLKEVSNNSDETIRKRMKQQYEKEYKEPAVLYLKKAERSIESPAYVEGLIALYEERFDDALKKAKEVYAKSRWSYEAKVLEGNVLASLADKKHEVGDYKGAIQECDRAGQAYFIASELGRSRADIYLSDCERWVTTLKAQSYTDASPLPSLQKGEEACNKAIQINPDNPKPYLRKANLYERTGRYQMYSSSEDPRNYTKKAIEFALNAMEKDPHSWETHEAFLEANVLAGEYEVRHGIDARNSLNEGIRHGNQALKIKENIPAVFSTLGLAYSTLGEFESLNGKNPIPYLEKSIQEYRKNEQFNDISEGGQIGTAYWYIAQYQSEQGVDPSDSYRKGIEEYEKFLKQSPDDPYTLYNLATIHHDQASYEMLLGKDPMPSFRKALDLRQKALKFIPNNTYILNGIGNGYARMSEYLVSQGKDATFEMDESRKFLKASSQVDPNYYLPYSNLGVLELAIAQQAINQGRSPLPYFDAARNTYQKSIECHKEEWDTYRAMADVYRLQAEWEIQQKRSAKKTITKGMEWADKALTMSNESPYVVSVRGVLFLLYARQEMDPAQRDRYASSAVATLEKVLKINPSLRSQYEPSLKEAKKILSN